MKKDRWYSTKDGYPLPDYDELLNDAATDASSLLRTEIEDEGTKALCCIAKVLCAMEMRRGGLAGTPNPYEYSRLGFVYGDGYAD